MELIRNYLNYTRTYNPLAVIDVEFTYTALNLDTCWKDRATETIACTSLSVSQAVVTNCVHVLALASL